MYTNNKCSCYNIDEIKCCIYEYSIAGLLACAAGMFREGKGKDKCVKRGRIAKGTPATMLLFSSFCPLKKATQRWNVWLSLGCQNCPIRITPSTSFTTKSTGSHISCFYCFACENDWINLKTFWPIRIFPSCGGQKHKEDNSVLAGCRFSLPRSFWLPSPSTACHAGYRWSWTINMHVKTFFISLNVNSRKIFGWVKMLFCPEHS